MDDRALAVVALTSNLVRSSAEPLSAQEFWSLTRRVEPSSLRGKAASDIASELSIGLEVAQRIAILFDRGVGLAIAMEKLDHSGIWTLTGIDDTYPAQLRNRLGDNAPALLHGVGEVALLSADGVGVVGSGDVTPERTLVAEAVARTAVGLGIPVVSGASGGVDQSAMNGAVREGGQVVGVLADSLERAVSRGPIRKGVLKGQICLITPHSPSAPLSSRNALGRNKIIYGLARCTVVVATELDNGDTWAGAAEAVQNGFGRVVSWAGAGDGNAALVELGATPLSDVSQLGSLLGGDAAAATAVPVDDQLSFEL